MIEDDDEDANVKLARTPSGGEAFRPRRLEGGSGRERSSLPVRERKRNLSRPPL